jgi:sec-independent protein translocase protein TatA
MHFENPLSVLVLLVIALLVLGPKRLPEAGRSIGQGIRQFRESLSGAEEDDSEPRAAVESPSDAGQNPPQV